MFIHLKSGDIISTDKIVFNEEGWIEIEDKNNITHPQRNINPDAISNISDKREVKDEGIKRHNYQPGNGDSNYNGVDKNWAGQ